MEDGVWNDQDTFSPRTNAYQVQSTGVYSIKCLNCFDEPGYEWRMPVIAAGADGITFERHLVTPSKDYGTLYQCAMSGSVLTCAIKDLNDGSQYHYRFAKRSTCEVVGDPGGMFGYPVLCK